MDQIDRLRAFNRIYTSELGLLERNYLRSGMSLPEIRVLYEIAHGPGVAAREIARLLRMDEGYLSRTIAKFERAGLIERTPDPKDRRRAILGLTGLGQALMAELETASRHEMGSFLDRVPGGSRDTLDASLSTTRHILGGVQTPVTIRGLQSGDPGWVIGAQGAAYARDEGYDLSFELLLCQIMAEIGAHIANGKAQAYIAEAEGDRLGCIFRDHEDDETARLRMFYVEPRARGTGLGKRLIGQCIADTRAAGYRKMVLWTHESQRAACALYARAGFTLVASQDGIEFGQPSVSQNWELVL